MRKFTVCACEKRRKWQDMKTESSSLKKKMSHGFQYSTHHLKQVRGIIGIWVHIGMHMDMQ